MELTLPTDCGNAPRIGIVSDFTIAWARGDIDTVAEWLTESVIWTLAGTGSYEGSKELGRVFPGFTPTHVEVIAVITHGRLASCNGYVESDSRRIEFSHTFRFASTSKTAKIAELQSYCIEQRAK